MTQKKKGNSHVLKFSVFCERRKFQMSFLKICHHKTDHDSGHTGFIYKTTKYRAKGLISVTYICANVNLILANNAM